MSAPRTAISPLDAPVLSLAFVGSARQKALNASGVHTIRDILYYFPRKYLDRSTIVHIKDVAQYYDREVTTVGTVGSSQLIPRGKKRLVVTIRDGRYSMDLVFFQGQEYWRKSLKEGSVLAVSGTINLFGRTASMVHPDIDRLQDEHELHLLNTGGIIPVYPSNAELEKVGLNGHHGFRKLVRAAFEMVGNAVEEFHTRQLTQQYALMPLPEALTQVHFPASKEQCDEARHRLIFDEFFFLSLQIALLKRRQSNGEQGIVFHSESPRARQLVQSLPFQLTKAQKRVIREITGDMSKPQPMNRLLQGDVGSGKTVVALLAMLVAVDNGYQAALMAPTEVLAEQHYRTITNMFNDISVNIQLLTGQQKQSKKGEVKTFLDSGNADIVIGTQALIQEGVSFSKLGLVVIDEQHRFGVMQRAQLRGKGVTPDVLVMTATPIPRTLSMTLYGDLDVSVIDEKPANRKRIVTAIRFEEDRAKVEEFLREEIEGGSQAYIIYPLVEESEKMDLKAATEGYEHLQREVYPGLRIGLLHGKMAAKEKDAAMMQFKRRELDILVSTTVIEVGVDVPNATVMLVEHAERFGLAQLHQLRGRVGRGGKQSYCILMTSRSAFYAGGKTKDEIRESGNARKRLETMRDFDDGFRISEIDLEIRGPGDLWGTMQSGFPELRIANLVDHADILQAAREAAFGIVDGDPHLRLPEHAQLNSLVHKVLRDKIALSTVA